MHHELGREDPLPPGGDLSVLDATARVSLAVWDTISIVGRTDQWLRRLEETDSFSLARGEDMAPTVFRVLGAGDSIHEDEWPFLTYQDASEWVVFSVGQFGPHLPYERSLASVCKAAAALSDRLGEISMLPGSVRENALRSLAQDLGWTVDDLLAHSLWMDLGAHHI